MSKKVTLKIDGKEVNVPGEANLIEAAGSVGIHIPNLCYLKGMRGIGACRLCLVEIEGLKAPMIACTTRAKDGMVVNTKTEKVEEVRKFVIDLILSMHPLDCMTCTKAGVCNLQQYAYDFELQESNFTRKKFGYPTDEANPFIKRDPDYCILCGRCVRLCKEQGTNVLDFMGRGVGAKIVTAQDKPLQESECTFCGSCVDACPVNALLEADRWRKGREWEYTKTRSACLLCGNGCDITVSTNDGGIVKINAEADEGSVEKYICSRGRFGFDSITSDARVTVPMKKVGNELQETTWKDALKIVADTLKKSGKNTGFISTGGILNQDAFILSKLTSDVIKTKNVDTTVSLYADADSMKHSDSVDMDGADVIVIAGLDPSQWKKVHPALDAVLRKRAARGARLIVINSGETAVSSIAGVNMRADEASALSQIAKALINKGSKPGKDLASAVSKVKASEEADKAADMIAGAGSPIIFTAPSLFRAAKNISLLIKDLKVVAVPLEANARGVVAMGLNTGGKTYAEMTGGTVDVLYAVGEVPVSKRPPKVKFLVAQTPYMTELAKQADVVLPAATYLESRGTITNYLGKVKDVSRVTDLPGVSKQHKDIFIELSKMIGKALKESASTIKSAFEVSAKPGFSPFEKKKGLDIDPSGFVDAINASVTNNSRLLWLKETEKTAV
ncbi:NADH-quinone oxidoreductase subunit 3 [bacterium BMS3Abin10]|nr:NADH-quinone oxidoreductase subunit 3 [bacterium BMS3Abin10]GBE39099.1 NADH-quinone oxidoreductase subunit 3 [bacterium BMS3Bbin08]HDH51535.1 2Fe-2S iron-sulfur cluster binding domain-containing protein [Nitrospirota bacterium]HDK16981.1 2Fe-2S iron-sulfur cluster binding domain-containing protein [Nitrospirota bacterium]